MDSKVQRAIANAAQSGTLDLSQSKLTQLTESLVRQFPSEVRILLLNNNQLLTMPNNLPLAVPDLVELHMRGNAIFALPTDITLPASLVVLDLSVNKLASIPDSIGKLNKLQRLVLQNNKLINLPSSINQMESLRMLYASSNKLTSLPESLCDERSKLGRELSILNLSENKIVNLPSNFGKNLGSLTSLNLSKNELRLLPPSLGNLTSLIELIVSNNKISTLPSELGQLSSLKRLDLGSNELTSLDGSLFANMGELRSLILNSNKLELLPDGIKFLRQLELLNVERNKLKELPAEVGFLSELKQLVIDHNQLEALPGEFDMIEDKLEQFTFEDNPFCGQLAPVEVDDELLEAEEGSSIARYELAIDEDNEDWEMKLVLEMLKEGEAFLRHGKGRPHKVHLSVSEDYSKIHWRNVIVQAQLARTASWSASKIKEMSALNVPTKTKIRKGGSIKPQGGKGRKSLIGQDFFAKPEKGSDITPLFTPTAPAQDQGAISVADVEKIVFGKIVDENEEDTDGTFFTIVATGGGLVLEASSSAERDEWARAFLMLLKYVTKLALKTLKQVTKPVEEESSSDEEEVVPKKSEKKTKKKKKGSVVRDDSQTKKKKREKETTDSPTRRRSQTELVVPEKKSKKTKKGSKIKGKSKNKKRKEKRSKKKTPRDELEIIEKQIKRQQVLLGTDEDEEVKRLMDEIRQIEAETARLEDEVIADKKPDENPSLPAIPVPDIVVEPLPDLPTTPRDEDLPPLPSTPKSDAHATATTPIAKPALQDEKKDEPAKGKATSKWAAAWDDLADDGDEEELKKLAEEKKKREEEEKKKKQEEEERKKKEEEERKRKEEEERKRREEEEEKRRKEEEEERRKFEEEEKKRLEELRKKREEEQKKKKEEEEKRKKRLEELLKQSEELKKQADAARHGDSKSSEAGKIEAARKENEEALQKIEEETQKALAEEEAAKRNERLAKVSDERAKAREARLSRLRAATESRSEILRKQKEEAEKQTFERKQRLIMLKEASVKRLKETTAVAEAIKLKDAEATKEAKDAKRQSALELAKEKIKQLELQKEQPAPTPSAKSLTSQSTITLADMKRAAIEANKKETAPSPRGPTGSMSIAEKRDMLKFMSPSKRLLQAAEEQAKQKAEAKHEPGKSASEGETVLPPKSTSHIDVSAMKGRARIKPGRRLPTRRRHAGGDNSSQLARQKSIPRAIRKIDPETFQDAVKISSTFSANITSKAKGLVNKGEKEEAPTPTPSSPSCHSCGFNLLAGSAFCTNCGTKQTGGAAASPSTVEKKTTDSPSKQISAEEKGLNEAERMRLRILQRKQEAAGGGSSSDLKGDTEAERMRQRIAEKTPTETVDMDELIERRRAESAIQKKHDAQNERDTIIANFMSNAKSKKAKFKPKLVQLKGKNKPKTQIVKMAASSLNEGDAYLLYHESVMYLWYGETANRMEKAKGAELTKRINYHECGGRHKVHIVHRPHDTHEKDDNPELTKSFWEILNGSESDVVSADAGGNDIAFERMFYSQMTLEKIIDSGGGKLAVETVEIEKTLSAKIMSSRTCYILGCGENCAYVWFGRAAPSEYRKFALKYAKGLKKAAAWMHLEKESDGGESILFREKFADWGDFARPVSYAGSSASSKASGIVVPPKPQPVMTRVRVLSSLEKKMEEKGRIDIERLHSESRDPPELYDNGGGKLEMWILENYELKEWPEDRFGIFYSAETFVLLYTYRHGGITGKSEQIRWLIYFWQGLDAKHQGKGASALKIKDVVAIVKGRGGDPDQVRVEAGNEPAHFLLLFNGKMVVHKGTFAEHSQAEDTKASLYHVHGVQDNYRARAVEVKPVARILNSRDCFILRKGAKQYIWCGDGSDDQTQEHAKKLAAVMRQGGIGKGGTSPPSDGTVIQEGHEPAEWRSILGDEPYANASYLKRNKGWRSRLYMCSSISGEYKVTRVWDYCQTDLYSSNCYLLDAWGEVYVWIGNDSTAEDERMAEETAVDYVQKAIDGRLADTPIYGVYEEEEPAVFTCHFRAWDEDIRKGKIGVKEKEKKSEIQTLNVRDVVKEYHRTYTFEELKKIPKGLDKTKLEQYLSDEDFKLYFKMEKNDFYDLPAWQQLAKRHEVGLY